MPRSSISPKAAAPMRSRNSRAHREGPFSASRLGSRASRFAEPDRGESDFDFQLVSLDAHLVRGNRLPGGWANYLTGPDVELTPMARTGDDRPLERSFGQSAPRVGAHVTERVVGAVHVREGDLSFPLRDGG